MSSRPRAIALAVALALILVGTLTAWFVLVPRYVRRKATETLHARYGVEATIAEVSVGFRGAELRGVRGHDGVGGAIRFELERVALVGSPWALRAGPRAAERIEIGPGTVTVSSTEASLANLATRLRSGSPTSAGSSGATPRAQPVFAVRSLRLVVEDEHGVLGEAVLDDVASRGDAWALRASAARAGAAPGDRLVATGLDVAIVRQGRLRLQRVALASLEASWATRTSDDAAAPRSLVRRLENAADRARRALRRSSLEEAEEPAGEPPWARRLAADFSADVERATFEGAAVAGTEDRLSFAAIRIERLPGDWLRCSGEGRGSRVGSARFSFKAQPDRFRAEGHVGLEDVPLALVAPLVPDVPWYPAPDAKISADLDLRTRDLESIDVRGALELSGFAVSHPRIAAAPLENLGFRVSGEGTLHPTARRLELRIARIELGDAHIDWTGTVERASDHYRVDGTLSLPPTPCDAAVHAIPSDVLGPLSALRLAGVLSGRMQVRLDSRELERTVLDFDVEDGCQFVAVPPEADVNRFAGPFTHQALEPDGTVFEMETGPGTGNWVSLMAISPLLQEAVVSHEDAAFYRHHGFAPWAIRDALVRNLEEGRYVVGASTITMQLVKNLFLRREKTLVRKIQEVLLTWMIEKTLDKPRILELYLNVIEYGPSVYGIRNATRHYFGREPMDLSPAEAAFLATILPAPKSYASMYESGTLSPNTRARVERFLRHLASQGRIGPEALEYGLRELETFRFRRQGEESPEPRFFREDFSGVFENAEPPPPDSDMTPDGWDTEP
ncbi:MAG: transglycosylase domain-containing protein, partial [Polyangiales bacterium]